MVWFWSPALRLVGPHGRPRPAVPQEGRQRGSGGSGACPGGTLNGRKTGVLPPDQLVQSPPTLISLQVFLGLHRIRDKHRSNSRSVDRILLHPHFGPSNYNNDIALLKLVRRVEFSSNVRPVCLPPAPHQVGECPRPMCQVDLC